MKRSCAPLSAFLGAIALLASPIILSAEHGWYVGGGYSTLSANYPPALAYPTDVIGTPALIQYIGAEQIGSHGFKVNGGYRALDWLALETDYLGLGANSVSYNFVCVTQPCPTGMRAETSAASLSALAMWPVGKFDLFARAGLTRWRTKYDGFSSDGSQFLAQRFHGTDEKFGGGAQCHVGKITARLEYERLRFSTASADSWSLGVLYEFR